MPEFVIGWDRWVFEAVNQGHRNALFDLLMPILSTKAYALVPGLVAAGVLVVWGGSRGRWAVPAALLAVLLADQGAALVKVLAARPRPCHALSGVVLLTGCTRSFAFPSSHATNMFALAAALGYHYRAWAWALGALAAAVAYSRVYVGAHYPMDVLGGAVLGVTMGVLALVVVEAARSTWRRRSEDRKEG